MAGFSAASGARVVAQHVRDDYAVVYVVTQLPSERGDYMSVMQRGNDGWSELAGGDGGALWLDTGRDDRAGLWALTATVEETGGRYEVASHGVAVTVKADEGYIAALLVGVPAGAVPSVRRVDD